ncbi:hypothetical protein C1H46_023076 [Malus baccata]|uniref:Uncharacterized protein n=1 Tax=Malus baccata TaxID=106549 RepID=A0A540LXU2_MALBA|nr:hypothetical protein C1H46_023076 [Malus baccata]
MNREEAEAHTYNQEIEGDCDRGASPHPAPYASLDCSQQWPIGADLDRSGAVHPATIRAAFLVVTEKHQVGGVWEHENQWQGHLSYLDLSKNLSPTDNYVELTIPLFGQKAIRLAKCSPLRFLDLN